MKKLLPLLLMIPFVGCGEIKDSHQERKAHDSIMEQIGFNRGEIKWKKWYSLKQDTLLSILNKLESDMNANPNNSEKLVRQAYSQTIIMLTHIPE